MKDHWNQALARVLVSEGGYSDNKHDPGGCTMKGITQAEYDLWRRKHGLPTAPVRMIANADVAAIYKAEYWDRIDGDQLHAGVDYAMFDCAVNSGVARAVKLAQGVLDTRVDGDLGPETRDAIVAADPEDFIKDFDAHRVAFLRSLKTYKFFGKGWEARVANVQKTSLAWSESGDSLSGPDPVQVATQGGHRKADSQDLYQPRLPAIAAQATTMAGTVGAFTTQATDSFTGLDSAIPWIKYILSGLAVAGACAALMAFVAKKASDAAKMATATGKVKEDADAGFPTAPLPVAAAVATPAAPAAFVPAPMPAPIPGAKTVGPGPVLSAGVSPLSAQGINMVEDRPEVDATVIRNG